MDCGLPPTASMRLAWNTDQNAPSARGSSESLTPRHLNGDRRVSPHGSQSSHVEAELVRMLPGHVGSDEAAGQASQIS